MLRLRKSAPAFVPVLLGGGAAIKVRAATQTDVEYAASQAQRVIAGMAAGGTAADALEAVLGDGYTVSAIKTEDGLHVAAVRLSEAYLVLRCQAGWTGVATEDGEPIAEPDAATLALLLADPVQRARIMNVVNGSLHQEIAEGNGSAASPRGGAATPTGAPTAAASATLVQGDSLSPETTAS